MMLKAFVAMRPMRAAEEIKPVVPTKHFNHFNIISLFYTYQVSYRLYSAKKK